jgi:hypothetical protein
MHLELTAPQPIEVACGPSEKFDPGCLEAKTGGGALLVARRRAKTGSAALPLLAFCPRRENVEPARPGAHLKTSASCSDA